MNFDKRSLIAIALCILFYLAYTQYLSTKYPEYGRRPQATETAQTATPEPSATSGSGSAPAAPLDEGQVELLPPEQLRFETDAAILRFDQNTGGLSSIVLKSYNDQPGPDGKPIDLVERGQMLVQGSIGVDDVRGVAGPLRAKRDGRTLAFEFQKQGFHVTQTYKVPEKGYTADLVLTFRNVAAQPLDLNAALLVREAVAFRKRSSFLPGIPTERPHFIYSVDDSVEREDVQSYCEDAPVEPAARMRTAGVDYLGIDRHYFLKTLLPKARIGFQMGQAGGTEDTCNVTIIGYQEQGLIQPGATATLAFTLYFGPKNFADLNAVSDRLAATVDYGTFSFIAEPLLLALQGLYGFLGNYGLAIVVLTLALKIIFYPLMKASSVSMHRMKKLNPEMQAIRERYKDDRQRQQQELMKFMAQHKINPAKGCLPILPQIPVFFAFYQVLLNSIELRHAPFFGWIQDLTTMDPFFVTPVLMGVAMFVQQKLTPTTGMDKTQEKIMMMMPVMFTAMMLTLPAGLTLYMLTNTVTSIVQQKWLYYKLDKLDA